MSRGAPTPQVQPMEVHWCWSPTPLGIQMKLLLQLLAIVQVRIQ